MKLSLCFAALIPFLVFSTMSHAKGSSGGGGSAKSVGSASMFGYGGVGVGGGNVTVYEPKGLVHFEQQANFNISLGLAFGKTPFSLSAGFEYRAFNGKLDYDYTSASNKHYTQLQEKFQGTGLDFYLGLRINLINTSILKLYAEGGGTGGGYTFSYASTTALDAIGTDYKKSNDKITSLGYYGEAGLEIIPNQYGLRLSARASNYKTNSIEELKDVKLRMDDVYAMVSIFRQLD